MEKDQSRARKWYDHGRPEDGTLTYNVNKGREIKRPKKAVRVTLKSKSRNSWILTPGYTKSVATENKKKPSNNNHAAICNRITGKMKLEGRMVELARSLRQGNLIGGSDASVKDGKGTSAWKISKPADMSTNMHGEGPIDGNP